MSWFFIALWAPFLLACANHNDKFLLSRYLKEKSIGSIVIPSSLLSGVAVPIVLFIHPDAGAFVIIVGALALSFELGRRGMRFRRNVVALMVGASFLSAVNGVIFKLIAVDKGFWVSLFWGFVGQVMAGLIFLACVPSYRGDFFGLFKQQKVAAFGLIALSKVLFSVSEAVTLYATLLAPVALVLLVNSFQPLFVFAFGIVLTLFLPRVAKESLGRMKVLQKGAGIGFMLVGSYLISR